MVTKIVGSQNEKNGTKRFLKESLPAYLMIFPSLIMFISFVMYPIIWVLYNAFYDTDGTTYRILVGFDNFIRMLGDKYWWNAVLNTLKLSGMLLTMQIPLALVLSAILNSKMRGKTFFRVVYYLPAVTSASVMSLVFMFMFSPYNGVINQYLNQLGMSGVDWLGSGKGAIWACALFALWSSFGGNTLLMLSGMQGIPADVYESASIDGASAVRQFFSITIPMLAPVLKTVIMLALIGSLQIMEIVLVMTNGGPGHATEVMPLYIYNQFFAGTTMPAYGYGAALGMAASIIIGAITVAYNMFSKQMDDIM